MAKRNMYYGETSSLQPHSATCADIKGGLMNLALRAHAARRAEIAVGAGADLGWLGAIVVALVPVAVFGLVLAGVRDLARVAVVRVDAAEDAAVDGLNAVYFLK